MTDPLSLPWRTGRHLGRTIYAMPGAVASDDDPVLGMMDSRELAEDAVDAHNWRLAMDEACAPADPGAVSS
jgi:hypothetical protein